MTTYTTHELTQGTPEWDAHRRNHCNASEAAAMLGMSEYVSRSELIRIKATGLETEHDGATMALFKRGHDAEAGARSIAESILQEDLYPATVSAVIDGLPLSASLDGLTMDDSVVWEHKLANASLMAAVREGVVPEQYRPQLEQQMLITGAGRAMFMVSDGTSMNMAYAWYDGDPALRARIISGWKQFHADVAAYVPQEVIPAPVVAAPDELPALLVELVGEVRSTNLATWQQSVAARIKAINEDLRTDEDFALADKTVKFLGDGEKKLEIVKSQALAQTASIDELFRTIDHLSAEMRAKRLNLEKLVRARKDSIRVEIMNDGAIPLRAHIQALGARCRGYMPAVPADFAGAIKGKKSLASMRDAVAAELARAKIAANEIADRIDANLKALAAAGDYGHLFPDVSAIVQKAPDDLASLIKARIADHEATLQAERERVAQQERERIEREERARIAAKAAEDARAEEEERKRVSAEQVAPATLPASAAKPTINAVKTCSIVTIRAEIIAAVGEMDLDNLLRVSQFIRQQIPGARAA